MANVVNRTTNEYRRSVHTPDYDDVAWLINPDTSGVDTIATKYWIVPQAGDPSIVVTADTITDKKDKKKSKTSSQRTLQESAGFTYSGILYLPDEQENADLYTSMLANVKYGTPIATDYFWRTSDGANTAISGAAELLKIYTAFNHRKDEIRKVYYNKIDEIDALATEQEIDDYDETAGWPEL